MQKSSGPVWLTLPLAHPVTWEDLPTREFTNGVLVILQSDVSPVVPGTTHFNYIVISQIIPICLLLMGQYDHVLLM